MYGKKLCILALAATAFWTQAAAVGQTLDYSSLLGGRKEDGGRAHVTAHGGSVIVVSTPSSPDFPVTFPSPTGSVQISVTKIAPNGGGASDLEWSLLLGGSGTERVRGLDVDASGNIYVTGTTASSDFLTTDGTSGPGIFVLKLTAGGSVVYSTVLGEAGGDLENGGLAVDDSGNAFVTGSTSAATFPDTLGTAFGGGQSDAVVARLDPSGSIVYSRFLGGSGADGGRDVALDSAGNAYVFGRTGSADFPVAGALQAQLAGPIDAFVARLDANGGIAAATYLG
ncbi:MAG: SBBP repeat-containing protein, partial [Thermoanaerobaculia bacterium]|nr:SBBP repeat-containing protein [Thermoanaerobaculia bacterium]